MSPGDRSYDAIGLMKQVKEQNAAAYAKAQEILENETPKAKDASGNSRDVEQVNNDPHNQPGNNSKLTSNVLVKLDLPDFLVFSDHFQ